VTAGLRYLLDTDVLSDIARNPGGRAATRLLAAGVDRVATSVVVAAEVRFGLARNGSRRLIERVSQLLDHLHVLAVESPADQHYAEIRHALGRSGAMIGPNDLFIAAHARALGLTLVSGNVREFKRVADLRVENWVERY
jgi:tRNA(fMet)-specific endonuclease VapC